MISNVGLHFVEFCSVDFTQLFANFTYYFLCMYDPEECITKCKCITQRKINTLMN